MVKPVDKIELLSDNAIKIAADDKFDRGNFVDSIVNIIQSQSSAVNKKGDSDYKDIQENLIIGIFGEWGMGKSSILNLLGESLQEKGFRSIYFNPWMYRSEDQVLVSLFNIIIENCGENKNFQKKLIELFKKYTPLITLTSPSLGNIANTIVNIPKGKESTNVFYYKEEIDKLLIGMANPLIIFIDDVDRLNKEEVHVLFKTLRLIASFKHVIYVVACDFEMVAKSIKENYADGGVSDGRAFIEKIIQIPIRIPEVKAENLFAYATDMIAKTTAVSVPSTGIFKELFERYFRTPRDVKRFINGFRYTFSYMKGSIPDIELLTLELIRVKVHNLFDILKLYYRAIGSVNPDTYYLTEISEYFKKNRKDFYLADGKLNINSEAAKIIFICFIPWSKDEYMFQKIHLCHEDK